jgi:hypothetical protein
MGTGHITRLHQMARFQRLFGLLSLRMMSCLLLVATSGA